MKLKKTREEILKQAFLNKADIQKILLIGKDKAKTIYNLADAIDAKELEYRIETTKVRMTSVCRVAGVTLKSLRR